MAHPGPPPPSQGDPKRVATGAAPPPLQGAALRKATLAQAFEQFNIGAGARDALRAVGDYLFDPVEIRCTRNLAADDATVPNIRYMTARISYVDGTQYRVALEYATEILLYNCEVNPEYCWGVVILTVPYPKPGTAQSIILTMGTPNRSRGIIVVHPNYRTSWFAAESSHAAFDSLVDTLQETHVMIPKSLVVKARGAWALPTYPGVEPTSAVTADDVDEALQNPLPRARLLMAVHDSNLGREATLTGYDHLTHVTLVREDIPMRAGDEGELEMSGVICYPGRMLASNAATLDPFTKRRCKAADWLHDKIVACIDTHDGIRRFVFRFPNPGTAEHVANAVRAAVKAKRAGAPGVPPEPAVEEVYPDGSVLY
jgi:hypothetical protein